MSASHDLTGLRRGNRFRRTFRFQDGSVLVFVAEARTARVALFM